MTTELWEDHLLDPDREVPEVINGQTWLLVLAADLRARDHSRAAWIEDVKHRLGLVTCTDAPAGRTAVALLV